MCPKGWVDGAWLKLLIELEIETILHWCSLAGDVCKEMSTWPSPGGEDHQQGSPYAEILKKNKQALLAMGQHRARQENLSTAQFKGLYFKWKKVLSYVMRLMLILQITWNAAWKQISFLSQFEQSSECY